MESNTQSVRRHLGLTRWDFGGLILIVLGIALHFRLGWWEKPFAVQCRLGAGAKPRLEDHITAGWWWAALLTLVLAFAVLATRPLWMAKRPGTSALVPRVPRGFWMLLCGCVIVAAALRVPRLGVSLYADEFYPIRTYYSGQWTKNTTGETEFKAVSWERTFFDNREANNHLLQSIVSRAALEIYRKIIGAQRWEFNEVAVRLPSLLAGLASVALLGLFLWRLGYPTAAGVAMVLLALHPWHLRYSTEARGYAFVFAGATLAMLSGWHVMRQGRLIDWIGYGLGLFIILAAFPGAIYLALCLTAALFLWFVWKGPRVEGVARLFVANAAVAAAFAWLYGPSSQQILSYLNDPRAISTGLTFAWLRDELAYFLAAMPWAPDNPSNPLLVGVVNTIAQEQAGRFAWVGPALLALVAVAFVAGSIRSLLTAGPGHWLVAASMMSVVLALLHCHFGGKLLFPWYLIFGLPAVVAAVALGVDWICTLLPKQRPWRWLAIALFLGGFVLLTARQTSVIVRHSREPNKEVAAAVLPGLAARELAGGFWTQAFNYEPRMRFLVTCDDVANLIFESRRESAVLRIAFGHRPRAMSTIPDTLAMVEDETLFTCEHIFYGTEADQFTHYVWRLREDATAETVTKALARASALRPR